MDGSTIPYYVVEERKKLNRCIEEAPNDYEKEIYRAIRNMPVPYEKLNEILENSRDIITSKQNRKALLSIKPSLIKGAAIDSYVNIRHTP